MFSDTECWAKGSRNIVQTNISFGGVNKKDTTQSSPISRHGLGGGSGSGL